MAGSLIVSASGIRGIVGDTIDPGVVARYGAAFGNFLSARTERPVVFVGRDSRTSGALLVDAACAGLCATGVSVRDMGIVPTPTGLLAVEDSPEATGGVLITASHNPAEWNGLKLCASDGSFVRPEDGREVQRLFEAGPDYARWDEVGTRSSHEGAIAHHIERILGLPALDVAAISQRGLRVVLDCVRGAGGLVVPVLLEQLGCTVIGIDLEADGRFPRNPEPTADQLGGLGERVVETGADIGLAVDPDVDRLAIVDERGRPIGEDWTLALAVEALASAEPPVVVTNLSSGRAIEDATRRAGGSFHRAPVGEANVVARMRQHGATIGGEGNGGVIYPALHYTRDAPLAAALILQWLVQSERPVSERVDALPQYTIVKRKIDRGGLEVAAVLEDLVEAVPGGAEIDRQDGVWFGWEDGRWLHVRPSGTEPIVRVIAEASTSREAVELADWVEQRVRAHVHG